MNVKVKTRRLRTKLWHKYEDVPNNIGVAVDEAQVKTAQTWEKILTIISSIVFLSVLLYAGLRSDPILDRQFVILRTLFALAGAGFVIGIPGFIAVDIQFTHMRVRAIGAIAVFVLGARHLC